MSYNDIKAETGYVKPESYLRRRRVMVKGPAVDLPTTTTSISSSSAEKPTSLEQPAPSINNIMRSGKAPRENNVGSMNGKSTRGVGEVAGSGRTQQHGAGPGAGQGQARSPVTVYVYPEPRRNSAPAMPLNLQQVRVMNTLTLLLSLPTLSLFENRIFA